MHATVPPRHDDHHIPRVDHVQQVQQFTARARLAVVDAVGLQVIDYFTRTLTIAL